MLIFTKSEEHFSESKYLSYCSDGKEGVDSPNSFTYGHFTTCVTFQILLPEIFPLKHTRTGVFLMGFKGDFILNISGK